MENSNKWVKQLIRENLAGRRDLIELKHELDQGLSDLRYVSRSIEHAVEEMRLLEFNHDATKRIQERFYNERCSQLCSKDLVSGEVYQRVYDVLRKFTDEGFDVRPQWQEFYDKTTTIAELQKLFFKGNGQALIATEPFAKFHMPQNAVSQAKDMEDPFANVDTTSPQYFNWFCACQALHAILPKVAELYAVNNPFALTQVDFFLIVSGWMQIRMRGNLAGFSPVKPPVHLREEYANQAYLLLKN